MVKAARHAAVSPALLHLCRPGGSDDAPPGPESTKLTEREHDVLLLLADGLGAAAIGEKLYLSESTAKSHIARIYQKLAPSTAPRHWSPPCASGCCPASRPARAADLRRRLTPAELA